MPVILSLSEVEKLISVTQNIKHKAILALAYSAGLKRMETQLAKPGDIDSARMQVRVVQGKGKKDRNSIFSPKALDLLRNYYKAERPKIFLFEPQGKKGFPLSEETLNTIVKKSAAKAGIRKRVSFHILRHYQQSFSSFVRPPPFNDSSFPEPTTTSTDSLTIRQLADVSVSPGKSIFLPPITAASTEKRFLKVSDDAMMCLLILVLQPHMRFLSVSTGVCRLASFTAVVADNQLATLTVRGVAPALRDLHPLE